MVVAVTGAEARAEVARIRAAGRRVTLVELGPDRYRVEAAPLPPVRLAVDRTAERWRQLLPLVWVGGGVLVLLTVLCLACGGL